MSVQSNTKHFTQLTQEQRVEIYAYLRLGMKPWVIAKEIGCHRTTIGREIDRNSIDYGWWKTKYKPLEAQKKCNVRRKKALESHIKLRKNHKLRSKIYQLLSDETKCWWPDEILGRLREEWWTVVATSTLYSYIHKYTDWWRYLRYKQEWYKNRRWKRVAVERIKGVEKIDRRCKRANERKRIWDIELDTIVSKDHKGGLCSAVDRKSRYLILRKVANLKKATLLTVLTSGLRKEGVTIKTLTSDNGSEFCELARLCKRMKAKGYTCHSYCSREKWTNERHNGFTRWFIPKKSNISMYSDKEIQEIQNKLNNKPRKILWYKTPYEIEFNKKLKYT